MMRSSHWTSYCVVALLLCIAFAKTSKIPRNHGIRESAKYRSEKGEDENAKDLLHRLEIQEKNPGAEKEPNVKEPEPNLDVIEPEQVSDVTDPEPDPDVTDPEPDTDVIDPEPDTDVTDPEPNPDVTDPEPDPDVTEPEPDVTEPEPDPEHDSDEKCKQKCGVPVTTEGDGVLCKVVEGKGAQCTCGDTSKKFVSDGKKCVDPDDECKEVCGVSINDDEDDVLCTFVEGKGANCSCQDEDAKFVNKEKKCQIPDDECREVCGVGVDGDGDVRCTIVVGEGAKCSCKENDKIFINKDRGCQVLDSECKSVCGVSVNSKDVLCTLVDGVGVNCTCADANKAYINKVRGCRVADEECNEFCGVPVKSDGDGVFCKIVVDEGAKCSCKEANKKFINKDKQCQVPDVVCNEVCGVPSNDDKEVRCTIVEGKGAQCSCEDDNKKFDRTKRQCIDDKCKTKCGVFAEDKTGEVRCELDNDGEAKCSCRNSKNVFEEDEKKCKADKCWEKCKVAHNDDKKPVVCKDGPFGDVKCSCRKTGKAFNEETGKCQEDKCYTKCGISFDAKDGDVNLCEGGPFGNVTCKCAEDKAFDPVDKKCKVTCSGGDCENGGNCTEIDEGGEMFCACHEGTTGDSCETVTECFESLKNCKYEKGSCVFDQRELKAVCNCDKGGQFYERVGHCEVNCTTDEHCSSNKKCNADKFCACANGYEGDDCQEITGCVELEKKCKEADAKCVFGEKPNEPKCECNHKGFIYVDGKCISEFCESKPCKDSKCEFDKVKGIGYCTCEGGKYYSYEKEKCETPDKCLLRKTPCEGGKVCRDGKCVCDEENFRTVEGKCISKFCDSSCFKNATCSAEDSTCACEPGRFYDGSQCRDASCFLEGFKSKCNCPLGMKREGEGECVPNQGELCNKDCGYGFCVKDQKGQETCKCLRSVFIAKAGDKPGKCVLKADKVCASKKLTEDKKKCECTGKYKQAEDGITCDLVTCADQVAKDECEAQGAVCKSNWKPTASQKGYTCECPPGFTLDNERNKCTDSCNVIGGRLECQSKHQLCLTTKSPKNDLTVDCKCPPPLKENNGKCTQIAEYFYLINNLPVLKKNYEMKGGINYVTLANDVKDSLHAMFSKDSFDYGYLYNYKEEGSVLKCDVWLKFNRDPGAELERIEYQAQKFPKDTCENCDENVLVLPPNLVMSEPHMKRVKHQQLKDGLCSSFSKNLLCGDGTNCENNKCFCKKGYKPLEYTLVEFNADVIIQRCEDIDECASGIASCPANSECVNTPGDYGCRCKAGYKKKETPQSISDKGACTDLCTPSPCTNGDCKIVDKTSFECECKAGFTGALCSKIDDHYKSAKHSTVVVGAVLGTILGVALIAFLLYYRKVRRSSYSEDFTPTPRQDHAAEMIERRPMRGVTNKAYE